MLAPRPTPKQDDRARMQRIHESADRLCQSRIIDFSVGHPTSQIHQNLFASYIYRPLDLEQYGPTARRVTAMVRPVPVAREGALPICLLGTLVFALTSLILA